jgi:hypothetical protein
MVLCPRTQQASCASNSVLCDAIAEPYATLVGQAVAKPVLRADGVLALRALARAAAQVRVCPPLRLCSDCAQTVLRLCSDCAQTVLALRALARAAAQVHIGCSDGALVVL